MNPPSKPTKKEIVTEFRTREILAAARRLMQSRGVEAVTMEEIAAAAGVLNGRTMTTVAKCALDVTQAGGKYVNSPCVVDGNMVSARTWHDNTALLKQFVAMLKAACTTTT